VYQWQESLANFGKYFICANASLSIEFVEYCHTPIFEQMLKFDNMTFDMQNLRASIFANLANTVRVAQPLM
jgi:hypothetical protein